jgi:hypothetical protein
MNSEVSIPPKNKPQGKHEQKSKEDNSSGQRELGTSAVVQPATHRVGLLI